MERFLLLLKTVNHCSLNLKQLEIYTLDNWNSYLFYSLQSRTIQLLDWIWRHTVLHLWHPDHWRSLCKASSPGACFPAKIFIQKLPAPASPPPRINSTSPNKKRDQFKPFPDSTDCHTKHIAMLHGLWPSVIKREVDFSRNNALTLYDLYGHAPAQEPIPWGSWNLTRGPWAKLLTWKTLFEKTLIPSSKNAFYQV